MSDGTDATRDELDGEVAADGENSDFDEYEEEYGDDYDYDDNVDDYDGGFGGDSEFETVGEHKLSAHKVPFTVVSIEDLEERQKQIVERVAGIIGVDASRTISLLHVYKWREDAMIIEYMENPRKALTEAGVYADDVATKSFTVKPAPRDFACFICCDARADAKVVALTCGHEACDACYRQYLTGKITEQGQVRRIPCPGGTCGLNVDAALVKQLVDADVYVKYRHSLVNTFVMEAPTLCWCPGADCSLAIECSVRTHDLRAIIPVVECNNGHVFCYGCKDEDHRPAPCEVVREWRRKCQDDSETSNWLAANTKDCPKCKRPIEKDGGCNHMKCRSCDYHFCWICLGEWSSHGTKWYNCSRFDSGETEKAKDAQNKSRGELSRYLFYYERYANHFRSIKLEKESLTKIKLKMKSLQEKLGMSWIEVQFLTQVHETLLLSRQSLSWAYAFAYYLKQTNKTIMFENNQKDLEMAVENLSEMFESDVQNILNNKVKMLDVCTYIKTRRDVLLDYAARVLQDGQWDFNVEFTD